MGVSSFEGRRSGTAPARVGPRRASRALPSRGLALSRLVVALASKLSLGLAGSAAASTATRSSGCPKAVDAYTFVATTPPPAAGRRRTVP